MDPLRVNLLGGFQLHRGDVPVTPPASRAARGLLAYLALHPDQLHSRDVLAHLFWPETDNDKARRRLSQALWRIREALRPHGFGELVHADSSGVSLKPRLPIEVDVLQLEARVEQFDDSAGAELGRRQALREAVDAYRGEFLERFDYEWVAPERERVRQVYLRGLEALIGPYRTAGKYEDALTCAQRYALHEQYHDGNHREIMRILCLLGRHREALEHYDRFAAELDMEFGGPPESETAKLAQEISAALDAPASEADPTEVAVEATTIPFVGRRRAKRALNLGLAEALQRRGSVALIEGEPGVGVSRLLEETRADAKWNGLGVLVASPLQEFSRPYGVIRDAIASALNPLRAEQLKSQVGESWLRDVCRVVPQMREWLPDLSDVEPLKPDDSVDRMREALIRTLLGLSRIRPHLLTIDNFQWIDGDSLRILEVLAEDLVDESLMMCIGYRTVEARERPDTWAFLTAMNAIGAERIELEPFNEAEADQFLARVQDERDTNRLDPVAIYRETGGNALFMLEAVQATEHAVRSHPAIPITEQVQAAVASRYSQLSEDGRTVAATMAVLGGTVAMTQLIRFCALGKEGVHRGLEELVGKSFIRFGGGLERQGYHFEYEQLRRVVYSLIGDRERRRIHRVIAAWLADEHPDDVDELAYHFAGAGDPVRAFGNAKAAADKAASVHAYSTAVGLYEQAIAAMGSIDVPVGEQADVYAGAESALEVLGDAEGRRAVLDAWGNAVGDRPELAALLAVRWSAYHASQSDFRRAHDAAIQAHETATAIGLPRERAAALLEAGRAFVRSNEPASAVPVLEQALALADGELEGELRQTLGSALSETQEYERAAIEARRALAAHTAMDNPAGRASALGLAAIIAVERGSAGEAEGAYEEAIATASAIGYVFETARLRLNFGMYLYLADRIGAAQSQLSEALVGAELAGSRRISAMTRANLANLLHRVLGDDRAARHHIEPALEYFTDVENRVGVAQCKELLALIAAAAGEHDDARDHIAAALAAADEAGNGWRRVHGHRAAAQVAEAADRIGDARQHIETAVTQATELGMAKVAITAKSHAGYLATLDGDVSGLDRTAAAMSAASVGVGQLWTIAYHHAAAAEHLGLVAQAQPAAERAVALLDEALKGLPEDTVRHADQWVPRHRALRALHQRYAPRVLSVRLPRVGVPTGRPIEDHEFEPVTWTLRPAHGEAGATQRRRLLQSLVEQATSQGAVARLEDLALALDASISTLKRDLAILRADGVELRTRGTRMPTGVG